MGSRGMVEIFLSFLKTKDFGSRPIRQLATGFSFILYWDQPLSIIESHNIHSLVLETLTLSSASATCHVSGQPPSSSMHPYGF